MNWLKVGAVVIGGVVVFFVLDSVVHLVLGLLTTLAFVAIVAGGGYVAYKVMSSRRRHQVKDGRDERQPRRQVDSGTVVVPPPSPTPAPAARPASGADVDDELARLKREMGH